MLKKNPVWLQLFSFGFVALYQSTFVLGFTTPVIHAAGCASGIGVCDWVIAAVFLAVLAVEFAADQQQWNFQEPKWAAIRAGRPLTRMQKQGFRTTGLWAFSRHPNICAEMTLWVVFYGFSVAASGRLINGSLVGIFALWSCLHPSINFGEKLTARKYPLYAEYQRCVPRWFPTSMPIRSTKLVWNDADARKLD
jgi:steroid 5-alpha reductase family enzyme